MLYASVFQTLARNLDNFHDIFYIFLQTDKPARRTEGVDVHRKVSCPATIDAQLLVFMLKLGNYVHQFLVRIQKMNGPDFIFFLKKLNGKSQRNLQRLQMYAHRASAMKFSMLFHSCTSVFNAICFVSKR